MVKAITSLLLFSIVLTVYWPVAHFSFLNFDDPTYVTQNPHVVTGLTFENIHWAFTESFGGHWHPLTWISHMLDCSIFGLAPGPMHVENALLHAINVVLVFFLFVQLFEDLRIAAVSALIFGIHPMRLESVVWISERKDVLSMLFGLFGVHCYLLSLKGRIFFWKVCLYISFILSLLAKPTFVTLPVLLVLLDWWPLQRYSRRSLIEKVPLALISLVMCGIATYAQNADGGLKSFDAISLADRMNIVWLGYGAYLGKFFAPFSIGLFYPFQRVQPGFGIGAFLGISAITVLVIERRKVQPWLLIGWLWFLVSLLPLIGFLPIGGQSYADRWSYVPHIGLLIGGTLYLKNEAPNAYRPILSGLAIFFVILTRVNLPYWQDSTSVFTHTLEVSPDNFMAHTNLGTAYDAEGELDRAKPHFEEALRLNPTYPEALNNVGRVRASEGRIEEAREYFSKAIAINPGLVVARYNLGLAYSQLQRPERALIEWMTVLSQSPEHDGALQSIRYTLSVQRDALCRLIRSNGSTELFEQIERWNASQKLSEIKAALMSLRHSC